MQTGREDTLARRQHNPAFGMAVCTAILTSAVGSVALQFSPIFRDMHASNFILAASCCTRGQYPVGNIIAGSLGLPFVQISG